MVFHHFVVTNVQGCAKSYSTEPPGSDLDIDDDDFLPQKPELQLQSVDPKRGWGFRGVHKVYGGIVVLW